MEHQKQIVLINDLSGFGRCALSVWLPILSVMQIECLLMPTAVLSNHTDYPSFYIRDLSEDMDPWLAEWQKRNIAPDAILTGYIANPTQGVKIAHVIDALSQPHGLVITDPAMADGGQLYPGLDEKVVSAMKQIVRKADVITPNWTEALLLCGKEPQSLYSESLAQEICLQLQDLGPRQIVITGIIQKDQVINVVRDGNKSVTFMTSPKIAASRCGTGDVFSSTLAGALLNGQSLETAVRKADSFVQTCLKEALALDTPKWEGVPFEMVLKTL